MQHKPIVHTLFACILQRRFDADSIDFALGAGGTLWSDIAGRCSAWLFFMVSISVFYRTVPPLMRRYYRRKHPHAPTTNVPQALIDSMVDASQRAFPLYVCVPVLTDLFVAKGWSMACGSFEECGGMLGAFAGCVAYFISIEFVIFVVHFYLLHKWDLGKRLGQHARHHVYKYANQLNAFSGYSFAPQDGFSQGVALALCTLFVRVPIAFVYAMEVWIGDDRPPRLGRVQSLFGR